MIAKHSIASGSRDIGSMHFKSQGTTDGDETLPDGDPMISMEGDDEAAAELGVGAEGAIEEVPL